MTADTLTAVESFIEKEVEQAQAKVDGADADKETRDEILVAKTHEFQTLEATLQEQEVAVAQATAALEMASKVNHEAKVVQKSNDQNLKELQANVEQLNTAQSGYDSLRDRNEDADADAGLLKSIVSVGKKHNFDSSMMEVAPVVLARKISDRSTFDNLVLSQLKTAIQEKLADCQKIVETATEACSVHASAVDESVVNMSVVLEKKTACVVALKEARDAKTAAKEALLLAKQSVSAFIADLKVAGDALDERKVALDNFRSGVKLQFSELRELAPAIAVSGAGLGQDQLVESAS